MQKKDKWYEPVADSVSKKGEVKLLGIMNIQCDHVINATIDMIIWLKTNRRESAPLSIVL